MNETVVPDRIGVEEGWRIWALEGDYLCSPFTKAVWIPRRKARAACSADASESGAAEHPAPDTCCECGIYAVRRLEYVPTPCLIDGRDYVVGQVQLWGKVIPGSRGWRAEFAYPAALFAPACRRTPSAWAPRDLVESVASLYGVGVVLLLPGATLPEPPWFFGDPPLAA